MGKLTRILFATDLHGSDLCFRKLINAVKIYKADVLIIGGDITGKAIVPVIEEKGIYTASFFDSTHTAKNKDELEKLIKYIKDVGFYPYQLTKEEFENIKDDHEKQMEIFKHLMMERLKEWIKTLEDHFAKTNVKVFIMPGNDDYYFIDEILNSSDYVVNSDKKVVQIDDYHEMITIGESNITPWKCPRDVTEEELSKIIEQLVSQVSNIDKSIFNIHVPPYGTKIDLCPKLDEQLRIVHKAGQIIMDHAGSKAVYDAIKKYQPLLGLHGHIHEAKGFDKIGKTLILNPGSEYAEGILHVAIINVDKDKVKGHMILTG